MRWRQDDLDSRRAQHGIEREKGTVAIMDETGWLPGVLAPDYTQHFHSERNRQGKGNAILFPAAADGIGESSGEIRTRERLGGLLKLYYRNAA
ncbi:MAG: hypothetical protein ABSA45_08105 [Verrucomicrobiota bacterium]